MIPSGITILLLTCIIYPFTFNSFNTAFVIAREVALRFDRLQRQWGPWGLAWWETLLRAADRQASRDNDERTSWDASDG